MTDRTARALSIHKRKKESRHPGSCRPRRLTGVVALSGKSAMLPVLNRSPQTSQIRLHDVEIQAGLRDAKCELRRPLRLLHEVGEIEDLCDVDGDGQLWQFRRQFSTDTTDYRLSREALVSRCPYGVPGSFLTVSEAWCWDEETQSVIYRADHLTTTQRADLHRRGMTWKTNTPPPQPNRLVYQIVDCWIDHLQPMTPLQLRNEGWLDNRIKNPKPLELLHIRQAFANHWDRSTLQESSQWRHNPLVWVLSLQRVSR